ncbi:MAG: hypothetical protein KGZ85_07160 [Ignavibacterium sp.]|nr:hypothetical protein [Ignavibacterium sp.]MBS4034222.1 hypothetical protein [Ignavibacterium sp.]
MPTNCSSSSYSNDGMISYQKYENVYEEYYIILILFASTGYYFRKVLSKKPQIVLHFANDEHSVFIIENISYAITAI